MAQKVLNPATGRQIQVNGTTFATLIRGGWFYADGTIGRFEEPRIRSLLEVHWPEATPDVLRTDLLRFTTPELMSIRHYIIHRLPVVSPLRLAQYPTRDAARLLAFPNPTSENRSVIVDCLVRYITTINSWTREEQSSFKLIQEAYETMAREIRFPSLKTRSALAVVSGDQVPAIKMIESGGVVDVLTQRWFRYYVCFTSSPQAVDRLDGVINLIKLQTTVPEKTLVASAPAIEPTREEIELRRARAEQTADERFDDRVWE